MNSQEAMKAVGAAWRKHKGQRGSGLVPAGQRGMGLVQAGDQGGEGFMDELSKWSGRAGAAIATAGAAIAGAVQPELAPVLEPAAAAAKGIVRGPARRDPDLVAVHDGLRGCEDVLRYIALLHAARPPPYRLRSRTKR